MPLTDRERAILDFEREWWTDSRPREMVINEHFELSTDRYHRILNRLLDCPEAEAYDPLVIKRLRRMRDRRRRARVAAAAAESRNS